MHYTTIDRVKKICSSTEDIDPKAPTLTSTRLKGRVVVSGSLLLLLELDASLLEEDGGVGFDLAGF